MLQLNELFNSKPDGENSVFKLDEPAVTPSYQTYRVTGPHGLEYQVKFDNRPLYGKNVQAVRIGQPNPDQKKFKPLVKKIQYPLDLFGAIKEIMHHHTFVNKLTAKKTGFILIIQQDKLSIPMALAEKIATKILKPTFTVVNDIITPTAEDLGGLGLNDGDFRVLVFRRMAFSFDNVFDGPQGNWLIGGKPQEKPKMNPDGSSNVYDDPFLNQPAVYKAAADLYNDPVTGTGLTGVKLAAMPHAATPTPPPTVAKPHPKVKAAAIPMKPLKQEMINLLRKGVEAPTITPFCLKADELAMHGHVTELRAMVKEIPAGKTKTYVKYVLNMLETMNNLKLSYKVDEVPRALTVEECVQILGSLGTSATSGGMAGAKLAMQGEYVEVVKLLATFSSGMKKSKAIVKYMIKVMEGKVTPENMPKPAAWWMSSYGDTIQSKLDGTYVAPVAGNAAPAVVKKPFTNTPQVTPGDGKAWFWAPIKAPVLNKSYGIGYKDADTGEFFAASSYKLDTQPQLTFGYYWFLNGEEALKARSYLEDQTFVMNWQAATSVKVAKGVPLPTGFTAAEVVETGIMGLLPDVTMSDGTAATFKANIEKIFMVGTVKGPLSLNQIYKWITSAFPDGVVNKFVAPVQSMSAGTSTVGSTYAQKQAELAAAQAAVAALKKPKAGLANGLRAATINPATIAWLSANPPASFEGKEVTNWDEYKNAFDSLSQEVIEVNGFELKFSASTPSKLFKQLDGFEKMVGSSSPELAAMKEKLGMALQKAATYSGSSQLAAFQAKHFPTSDAIKSYTGSNYSQINGCLRGGDADDNTKNRITQADNYFQKHGARLPKHIVVYRGQSILISEMEGLLNGLEYVMHGYVSTSINLSTANGFMGSGVQIQSKNFLTGDDTIKVFKTAADLPADKTAKIKCMLVITGLDNCLSVVPGSWGQHQGECEVVINRGSRLKIDPSIPIKAYGPMYSQNKEISTALIYCTMVADGAIDYGVNEMTEDEHLDDAPPRFSERVQKKTLDEGVVKTLIVDDFVKNGKPGKKPEDGDARWTDDIFS